MLYVTSQMVGQLGLAGPSAVHVAQIVYDVNAPWLSKQIPLVPIWSIWMYKLYSTQLTTLYCSKNSSQFAPRILASRYTPVGR